MASSDLGQTLRRAREARGLSLDAIARRTNIALRVLASIERNAMNEVPSGLFTRGYLRAYAQEVGLDGERIVREYLTEASVESDAELLEELRARYSVSDRNRRSVLQLALIIVCLSCLLYLFTRGVSAQQVSARVQRPMFRSTVELVVVRVTVADRDKRPIAGLTREDFVVLENGARQQVSHFLSSDVPLDVALLLDASSSMKPILSTLRASAVKFLSRLHRDDRGMVVGFSDRTEVLASLTGDESELRRAVDRLHARGDTRLYDGMYITLGTLSSASRDVTRRQALVVLSDGHDTASHLGLDDVRRQASVSGVPIYPILLTDQDAVPARDFEKTFGLFDIVALARDSGGQAFRIDDVNDLEQAYGLIAQELSEQYVLAYPATVGDRETRIVVEIPSHPEAVARAHVGYVNRSSFGG